MIQLYSYVLQFCNQSTRWLFHILDVQGHSSRLDMCVYIVNIVSNNNTVMLATAIGVQKIEDG